MRVVYTSRQQVDELVESLRRTRKLDGVTFGQRRDQCNTFHRKAEAVFEPVVPGGPESIKSGCYYFELPCLQRSTMQG